MAVAWVVNTQGVCAFRNTFEMEGTVTADFGIDDGSLSPATLMSEIAAVDGVTISVQRSRHR